MNAIEIQTYLDQTGWTSTHSKPKPLEGNGYRISNERSSPKRPGTLYVQDLLDGHCYWFPTVLVELEDAGVATFIVVQGGRASVAREPYLAQNLAGWLTQVGADDAIRTGEFVAALLDGDQHSEAAARLVPTFDEVRVLAANAPYQRHIQTNEVASILMVVTALANLGGKATTRELLADLTSMGMNVKHAEVMLHYACKSHLILLEKARAEPVVTCARLV